MTLIEVRWATTVEKNYAELWFDSCRFLLLLVHFGL